MNSSLRTHFLIACVLLLAIATAGAKTWTVKKGETCYRIAKANGITASQLMKANGITDPTQLRIGQKLSIPGKNPARAKSAPVKVTPNRVGSSAPRRTATQPAIATKTSKVSSTRKNTSSSSRAKVTRRIRVIIDPGHGGKDKGAYWYGVSEAALNLKVARLLEKELKARGYAVTMTRRSDYFLSLGRRSRIANQYQNQIFVSVHFNACTNTSVHGAETFYAGRKGRFLAQCIQSRLVRRLKVRNRGVRIGRYAVLMGTKCPAVLVECGFISNARERKRCNSSWYQQTTAKAIADGIVRYDRVY